MWRTRLKGGLAGLVGKDQCDALSKKIVYTWEAHRRRPLWGERVAAYNYKWHTYDDIFLRAQVLGKHLLRYNIANTGDVVGICCPPTSEWMVADLACSLYGMISLPIDTLAGQNTLSHICTLAQPKAVLCTATTPTTVRKILSDNVPLVNVDEKISSSASCFIPEEILHMTEEEDKRTLFTLQPTSGSTGHPKLLKRTRWNWCQRDGSSDITMLIGSLSSPAPRSWMWLNLLTGGATAESSMESLIEDCQSVQPTQVSAPPLVWDSLVDKIKSGRIGVSADPETGSIDWAANLFGRRCKAVTNTGAAISPSTLSFMKGIFRAGMVHDGYGSSEAGGIAVNGELLHGVEIRLQGVPELGYLATDTPYPRGELLVKTTTMFDGYLATTEDEDKEKGEAGGGGGGWMATGDIVRLLSPNRIEVIDRRSACVKLRNGKYVAPTLIENSLLSSPLVRQAYVHVDGNSSKLIAVVVPHEIALRDFLVSKQREELTSHSLEGMCQSKEVRELLLAELQRLQREAVLSSHETLRGILLSPLPFTQKDGLLTPSLKPRRHSLSQHFAPHISSILNESESEGDSEGEGGVEGRVLGIVRDVLGRAVPAEAVWDELGLDSLAATQLAQKLTNAFNTPITVSAIFRSSSIRNLAASLDITTPSSSRQQHSSNSFDYQAELDLLNADISAPFHWDSSPPNQNQPQNRRATNREDSHHILLTGASGFLGAHVLDQLLTLSPHTRLTCIVRGEGEGDAASRLSARMAHYGLPSPPAERLRVVCGDIRTPLHYTPLHSDRMDAIVHCAANVNWVLPYSALRGSNTLPLHPILRLAHAAKSYSPSGLPPSIHYVSTIAVGEEGSCESRQPLPSIEYGYGASKWAAEFLLSRAQRELDGLSTIIYRPGHLVPIATPYQQSMGFNRDDYLSLLIRGCIFAGGYPNIPDNVTTEWTCVHTTARLIAQSVLKRLAANSAALPSEFNMLTDKPTSYQVLFRALEMEYSGMRGMSVEEWRERVLRSADSPLHALSLSPLFSVGDLSGSRFGKSHTHSNTRYIDRNIEWPIVTTDTARGWIQHLKLSSII